MDESCWRASRWTSVGVGMASVALMAPMALDGFDGSRGFDGLDGFDGSRGPDGLFGCDEEVVPSGAGI